MRVSVHCPCFLLSLLIKICVPGVNIITVSIQKLIHTITQIQPTFKYLASKEKTPAVCALDLPKISKQLYERINVLNEIHLDVNFLSLNGDDYWNAVIFQRWHYWDKL